MYRNSINRVRKIVITRYPNLSSKEHIGDPWLPREGLLAKIIWILWLDPRRWSARRSLYSNIVWMCDRIEVMEDREKASRWIGWILAMMEMWGGMRNRESRDLIREDLSAKDD